MKKFGNDDTMEAVIRERPNDVAEVAALDQGKLPGRILTETRAAPTTTTTTAAGDVEGDMVITSSYIYQLYSFNSTLKWHVTPMSGVQDTAINTTEIKALHSTAKTIVTAQGANTAIIPSSVSLFLDYNSAAYAAIAAGDDLFVRYTGGSEILMSCETTGFLDQTSDQRRLIKYVADITNSKNDWTPVLNAALEIYLGGAITTGDSPMGVRTEYTVMDFSTLSAT